MAKQPRPIVPKIPETPDKSGTFKSIKEYKDIKVRLSFFDKVKQFINKLN
jgi:hypothetical protein